jgi:glycosyltransferase involved in cell wall biosynthesis
MKPSISAIIIAKNEELMIANCIEGLRWCDEIVVLDNGSIDRTNAIAEKLGAKIVSYSTRSLADLRNYAIKKAKGDWLFYIDADERVTPQLAKEIAVHAETNSANALTIYRQNLMYGKLFHHGGWQKEQVTRVFRTSALQGWQGDIHESPIFEGQATTLHSELLHLTHRNTRDGLLKSIDWTPIEARLLFEAKTPPVTLMTLLRKGGMEFLRRAILRQGWKDGMAGWIESLIQGINKILVYVQLWELQQQPTLEEIYQQKEREILQLWQKEK